MVCSYNICLCKLGRLSYVSWRLHSFVGPGKTCNCDVEPNRRDAATTLHMRTDKPVQKGKGDAAANHQLRTDQPAVPGKVAFHQLQTDQPAVPGKGDPVAFHELQTDQPAVPGKGDAAASRQLQTNQPAVPGKAEVTKYQLQTDQPCPNPPPSLGENILCAQTSRFTK